MKPIKDLLKNPTSPDSQDNSKPISQQSDKVINRVFAVMMIKYTHKWASQLPDEKFTEEAKRVWARDLAGLTPDQIKQGLDMATKEYPDWPPTIGQFRELCKVGEESKRQLSLPDKSRKAITKSERLAIWDKYGAALKSALNN